MEIGIKLKLARNLGYNAKISRNSATDKKAEVIIKDNILPYSYTLFTPETDAKQLFECINYLELNMDSDTEAILSELYQFCEVDGFYNEFKDCGVIGDSLYVVTREGVYRHEILGIYTKSPNALAAAKAAAGKENDNYHDIVVSKCKVDEVIEDVEAIDRFTLDDVSKMRN